MKSLNYVISSLTNVNHLMVLLFVAVFPIKLQCQHVITQCQYPDDVTKTIVKEYIFPATISYVETTTQHYFSYSNASMSIINCEISENLYVRDFVVVKDTIYFCGYNTLPNAKTVGVWGYFNANNLINGSLNYAIYDSFVCAQTYADTLNSLVVYNNEGVTTSVVVGSIYDGTSIPRGCTIEITPSTVGTYAWNYTMGVTPDDRMENIKHVCLTDNFIITSGHTNWTSSFEVYRRHLRNNIFAAGGPQDQYWTFPTSNNPRFVHYYYPYAITHIGGDTIVAVLSYENISVPPHQYGLIVKTYDMSNPVMGVTSSFFVFHQPTLNELISVQGLKYSKPKNSVILLLYGKMPIFPETSSIIAEIQITSATPTPCKLHYTDLFKLTTIDLFNNGHNIVCQGNNRVENNIVHYYTQPLLASALCLDNYSFNCNYEIYITKGDPSPYKICNDSFNCKNCLQMPSFTNPNEIICSQ